MKMFSINYQKNHARQLVHLTLATILLTSIVAHPSYSSIISTAAGGTATEGAMSSLTQTQKNALTRQWQDRFRQ